MDQNEVQQLVQRELQHHRELTDTKLGALSDNVYTFRKQVLGNGQPGDLDRMRGVINEVKTKSDDRNKAIWEALDDIRAKYVPKADYDKSQADIEDLKKQRWIWVGALSAIFGGIEVALHFIK